MKHLVFAGAFLLGAAAAWGQSTVGPGDWKGYTKGVKWEASLDAAKARAAREHKPILLYQLVGDLNKEGC